MRGANGGPTEDRIIVYPSRWKLVLLALGSLVFVFLCALIVLGWFGADFSLLVLVAAYVGVPFFSLCFVYWAYRLLRRKPSLVVDERGIYDNASAIGAGWLGWEEIKEMYVFEYQGQTMLGIVPEDEEAILSRQSTLKRLIMRINTGVLGVESLINIPQTALPISVEELLARAEQFRARRAPG
jgi:hypothetical protein